jgi:endoglucanase
MPKSVRIFVVIATLQASLACGTPKRDPEPPAPAAIPATFSRGFNFGNRLDAPNEGDWGPALRGSDFATVAARGFDHVRLPVRFSGHAPMTAPFTIDTALLQRVDWALTQASQNGLSVVLAFQYYDELMRQPDAHWGRFLALWDEVALRYQTASSSQVAFELLSEPNGALEAQYNDLVAQAVTQIRRSNPDRRIIVNSTGFARTPRLAELVLPEDPNIVASVHVYAPEPFTFQGAPWAGNQYGTTGVVFPGPPETPLEPVTAALANDTVKLWFEQYNTLPTAENPAGPSAIDATVTAITTFVREQGHEVYVGEMGATVHGDEQSRFNFLSLLRERFEAENLGWAVWDNNGGDMAVLGSADGTWRDSTINALIPEE